MSGFGNRKVLNARLQECKIARFAAGAYRWNRPFLHNIAFYLHKVASYFANLPPYFAALPLGETAIRGQKKPANDALAGYYFKGFRLNPRLTHPTRAPNPSQNPLPSRPKWVTARALNSGQTSNSLQSLLPQYTVFGCSASWRYYI